MKLTQHYSSSSGNFYVVESSIGKRLLIECGIRWSRIQKALNFDLTHIECCLLSHSHKDHSHAIKEVMQAGIDIYSSEGTFESCGIHTHRKAHIVADKTLVRLPHFEILCFGVNHDANEPLGFIVRDLNSNEFLLFATDTSHIVQKFNLPFSIIAIECSFDKDLLRERVETGKINKELAKRLLSSHMEKSNTIKYISEHCNLTKCTQIHLLHLSSENIDAAKAKREVEEKFYIEVVIK